MPASASTTPWQLATVVGIARETARAKTFRLRLAQPRDHLAGQHYVVRLTAPDGYTASRSYSVASSPLDTGHIELTVERLDGGEVSTFLHDVVEVGDTLEVRGPIGGWFVWDGDSPALLLAGGSGVVPFMAMLRLARGTGRADLLRVVVSVRTPADLYYPEELPGAETVVLYTRQAPAGVTRPPGHLTMSDLPVGAAEFPRAFVCGSSNFANHATDVLLSSGLPATALRIERFGPSGGAGDVPPGPT